MEIPSILVGLLLMTATMMNLAGRIGDRTFRTVIYLTLIWAIAFTAYNMVLLMLRLSRMQ